MTEGADFSEFSNWGRWGDEDRLGALNLITAEKRRQAAGLVRDGVTVSCSRVIEFAPRPDPAEAAIPPLHFMQAAPAPALGMGSAYDWIGLPLHGLYLTHLDAHAHISWDGKLYNGQPAGAVVTDRGATLGGIDLVHNGIFTRGILLDVARARGVDWLTGDAAASADDLDAAEVQAGVSVEPGDVILVRTGYGARRLAKTGPGAGGQPGLAPNCLRWIHGRSPAVLGTDTGTDPAPAPGSAHGHGIVASPVHVGCIAAMGMWVIDGCDLEALAEMCGRMDRWEFLFTAAPLRLKNSTGSPLNPVAIF